MVLAICDPIAALTGKRWPIGRYKIGKENKTLMGTSMFFVSAFTIVIVFLIPEYGTEKRILIAFSIAFISAASEALSRKGYDNITIPASVLLSLIIFLQLF